MNNKDKNPVSPFGNYFEILMMETKLRNIVQMFYDSDMIQWTPDRRHYSWQLVTSSKAEKLLKDILNELLSKEFSVVEEG